MKYEITLDVGGLKVGPFMFELPELSAEQQMHLMRELYRGIEDYIRRDLDRQFDEIVNGEKRNVPPKRILG